MPHLHLWLAAVVLASIGLTAGPAAAAWYRVETDRFIVYGEGSEQSARDYAGKLTTFDLMLRETNPGTREAVTRQKLEVYLVRGRASLARISPGIPREAVGFYAASSEAVFAVAQTSSLLDADTVLFHEYSHHFMWEHFPNAYPSWFVEGWAEYYMTTDIQPKVVKVGAYNVNRMLWLLSAPWLPMEEVLSKRPSDFKTDKLGLYYAQAWLLMHYMRATPERGDQLNEAAKAIGRGQDPVKALQSATGMDMAALTSALKNYTELSVYVFPNPQVTPRMTVVRLPASTDDLILENLRLAYAPGAPIDPAFLKTVREKAAKHPADRFARLTLARAEYAIGDISVGRKLVDELIAADPADPEGYRIAAAGEIAASRRDPALRKEHLVAARQYAAKGHALAKDDYRLLLAYAKGRMVEPNFPTDNDLNALQDAHALAPSVTEVSILAGSALLFRNRREEGVLLLERVANNPHGGRAAAQARAMIAGKPQTKVQVNIAD